MFEGSLEKTFNDLAPFEHGDEGTHSVCAKHDIGDKSVCCECAGKTDCGNTPSISMPTLITQAEIVAKVRDIDPYFLSPSPKKEWQKDFNRLSARLSSVDARDLNYLVRSVEVVAKQEAKFSQKKEILQILPEERIIHSYMREQDEGMSTEYCEGWNDYRLVMIDKISNL